jgi:hypothetical protein
VLKIGNRFPPKTISTHMVLSPLLSMLHLF